jgi:hypothetical protein
MPGKVYADLCPKVGQWFDGGDSFWSEGIGARQGSAKPVMSSCFPNRVTHGCPRLLVDGVFYFTHCRVSRCWVVASVFVMYYLIVPCWIKFKYNLYAFDVEAETPHFEKMACIYQTFNNDGMTAWGQPGTNNLIEINMPSNLQIRADNKTARAFLQISLPNILYSMYILMLENWILFPELTSEYRSINMCDYAIASFNTN